jgi:hypothetical protein
MGRTADDLMTEQNPRPAREYGKAKDQKPMPTYGTKDDLDNAAPTQGWGDMDR